MSVAAPLVVREGDRPRLEGMARSSSIRAGLAQRARIVLLAAEGLSSDHYERKAVRIAVLVAGLLSALMLLAASLTDALTFGTASGLLGWVAALAFAITTVLPGWLLRRNSGMGE